MNRGKPISRVGEQFGEAVLTFNFQLFITMQIPFINSKEEALKFLMVTFPECHYYGAQESLTAYHADRDRDELKREFAVSIQPGFVDVCAVSQSQPSWEKAIAGLIAQRDALAVTA